MFDYLFGWFINHSMFNFPFINLCFLYYLNGHLNTQNSIICLFCQKSSVKIFVTKFNFAHLFTSFLRTDPTIRYFIKVKFVLEVSLKYLTN